MKTILINESHLRLFEGLEENMVPTKQWMEQKYNHFNNELFNGFLPKCKLSKKRLSSNYLGMYTTRFNHSKDLVTRDNIMQVANPTIYLTTQYSAPEYVWENVLIHEMCHYYTQFDEDGNVRIIDSDNDGHGADFFNAAKMVSNASGGKYDISRIVSAEHYKQLGYETKDKPFSKMRGKCIIKFTVTNEITSVDMFVISNNILLAKQLVNMADGNKIYVTDNQTLIKILLKNGYKEFSSLNTRETIYQINPAVKELFDKCHFIEFTEDNT